MNKKNFFLLLLLLFFSAGMYFALAKQYTSVSFAEVKLSKQISSSEKAGFSFLLDRMQNKNGLLYSWVDYENKSPDILLETMGQALEYFALLDDRSLFEYYWQLTDHYFTSAPGYYLWHLDENSKRAKYFVTAFVDDLRLAKAVFIARDKGFADYNRQLKRLSGKIYRFNVDGKNKLPVDFYDSKMRKKASELSLFYIDTKTLGELAAFDPKWRVPCDNAAALLKNMPERGYGFYPQKYSLTRKEYLWQDPVNMVENLYTALNAKEAQRDITSFADFLRTQIKKGYIYNHYYLSGEAANADESASIYALAARLFYLDGDLEAARWCYEKAQSFQISDAQNAFSGGFGDTATGKVFSFNQMETLLMYRYLDGLQKVD